MTREELLELAALDVFGLLDEYEASLYTRSFHHAPAAVQDEIVDLQAEIAGDETLLPGESPEDDLRDKVLAAVCRSAEHENSRLAPIASIGPRLSGTDNGHRRAERGGIRQAFFGGSGQAWRAAAFALTGALIVVSYFWAEVYSSNSEITRLVLGVNTSSQIETLIGPSFKSYLFDPGCTSVVLADVDADPTTSPVATILARATDQDGFVVFDGLAIGDYVLSIKDEFGARQVANFKSEGALSGFHIAADIGLQATWTISTLSGTVVLRSA